MILVRLLNFSGPPLLGLQNKKEPFQGLEEIYLVHDKLLINMAVVITITFSPDNKVSCDSTLPALNVGFHEMVKFFLKYK